MTRLKVKDSMGAYESITALRRYSGQFPEEIRKRMEDVLEYAESSYIDHCEEIGEPVIENLEDMIHGWADDARIWLSDYLEHGTSYNFINHMER